MNVTDLERNPWDRAADYIIEHDWTKGEEVADDGKVCIEGAVRLCSPKPGDGVIHREVLSHRRKGATFNDAEETTVDDVLRYLREEAAPITDDELLDTFGPQWEHIVAMVREVASWPNEKQAAFNDLCWKAWNDGTSGYDAAWRAVVDYSGPGGAARRALGAVGGLGVGGYVAAALARRHEIGSPGGITQEHYDALGVPWRAFTNTRVHPDDAAVA